MTTATKKIITFRERREDEMGYSICKNSGPNDGHEIRMVRVTFDDGSEDWLFKSNVLNGFFKQAIVPWDFEHEKVVMF